MAKMFLKARLMTPIFNTDREYPRIHVWYKFGDSSPILWRVIAHVTTIPLRPQRPKGKNPIGFIIPTLLQTMQVKIQYGCHHKAISKCDATSLHDDVIKWKHFRVTGPLWGSPLVTGGFPSQRPVTPRFAVIFDLRLNKRLSKQPRRRWF